ncbi:MAG: homoserine dehydrogenase [Planctomycetes bacterium]|nr:homoserine dehydrogenase [Planctomycetota bacterium]
MGKLVRVGLIGCGTVGQGVVRLLHAEGAEIERKTGLRLELVRVADKDPAQARKAGVPEERITADAGAVIEDQDISVVVELVGGTGAAKDFVVQSLRAGKDVVTANKALLARFGREIHSTARANRRCVAFEASCGGGIPLILPLRTGLIANRISAVYGILNGTCNYILTEMSQKGKSYAEALKEAQASGYAEPDPTLDVSGGDTAHKLAILASIAFGCDVDIDRLHVEGIQELDAQDLAAGRELGYVCKLLGIAARTDAGLSLRVHPSFVRKDHPLASTSGSFNAISVYGNWVGHTLYYGRGAGSKPTASAVVADLVDVGLGNAGRTFEQFRILNDVTEPPLYASMDGLRTRFYVRLMVADRPGVMAQIAKAFGDKDISLRAVTQHEPNLTNGSDAVPVVVLTHEAVEGHMREALREIAGLAIVRDKPVMIRVVEEHEEYTA